MTLPETARSALYLALSAILGAILGIFVWERYTGMVEDHGNRGAVSRDTSELTWGDMTTGLLPNETRLYAPTPTIGECLSVPELLVDTSRGGPRRSAPTDAGLAAPDTVVEYRTRFTEAPPALRPSLSWGDRTALRRVAQSRHPFLFLPLTESGEPAIDHDGRRTIVPALDQEGNGYEFTYRYRRRPLRVFVEAYLDAKWWPPLRPDADRLNLEAGADVGLRYKSGRIQLGPQYSSVLGPAVHVRSTWRPWSYAP